VTQQDRISRLEGAYEQVNERLGDLSSRMDSLESQMNSRFSEMNSRLNELNSRFNTLYIVLAGGWVTLMAAIIAVMFVR
jgi:flagellar capping protein FliD